MSAAFISSIARLPKASDSKAVERGLSAWREACARIEDKAVAAALTRLIDDRTIGAVMIAVFGNSPFLSHCVLADPADFAAMMAISAEDAMARLLRDLDRAVAATPTDTKAVMAALRLARRRAALVTALADIAQIWSDQQVTAALSDFADAAVAHAVDHLLACAAADGDLELRNRAQPSAGSGLIVLALGKLGGRELNYSSDIDLMVLFDSDAGIYRGRRDIQDFFVRLARRLVVVLEERTAEGYVFRTDLRLRPDPGATPLAISVAAAESYYASLGQNWERAAMIKARPVAGDHEAGEAFLASLRSFLWRKHLDFAAIQDIHSIKRQIQSHRGGGTIAVAGHNLKLGRGGIREIEFFAQTQQLIWGGRYADLRMRPTCAALAALRAHQRISAQAEADLCRAYWFLRRTEHRLQMIDDRQTQTVPEDAGAIERLAVFLGYSTGADFAADLTRHLTIVADHYSRLFSDSPDLAAVGDDGGSLVFTGVEDDPETLETLTRMGYRQGSAVAAAIRGWHHGRIRATRSARARELLTALVPGLLAAFARTADPDRAFLSFDAFLTNLPAGVQMFSLFQAQPRLLDLVAEIMGSAPRLADYLSGHTRLLDAVLTEGFFEQLPPRPVLQANLARELGHARDFQDALDIARGWAGDAKFQVSVQQLQGMTDARSGGDALTAIAEVVVAAMVNSVEDDFARLHGRLPGASLAVLGYGKLGSRTLTRGSDLDLVFVYDLPAGVEQSDGAKPLNVLTYYLRLCQRLTTALTAKTGEGQLYAVDLRLRPMGDDGPLASSVASFERYYRDDAWTWELMALTRARVIAAAPALAARIEAIIRQALTRPRDPDKLLADVASMRQRIFAQHGSGDVWAIKHVRGGLIDVEFIAQYLQLRQAPRQPMVLATSTLEALERLAAHGCLDPGAATELASANRLLLDVQAIQRLTLAGHIDEQAAPEGLKRVLARVGGAVDFADLKAKLVVAQAQVLVRFQQLIAEPAARLPEPATDMRGNK